MTTSVAIASSPISFVFRRGGGAVVHARLSVWGTADDGEQKRVLVLFFEDSLDETETYSRVLPKGNYSCVLLVFVREDLNGTYDYEHLTSGQSMAQGQGDVDTSPNPQDGAVFKREYVLSVV